MRLQRGMGTLVGNRVNSTPVPLQQRLWLHLDPEDLSGVEFKCKGLICLA